MPCRFNVLQSGHDRLKILETSLPTCIHMRVYICTLYINHTQNYQIITRLPLLSYIKHLNIRITNILSPNVHQLLQLLRFSQWAEANLKA